MTKKRNLSIDYDTAKKWYEGTNEELKQLALETFPELSKKELPKTWNELKRIKGFYVNTRCNITQITSDTKDEISNTFATQEQAEALIALAQLSQLREVYRKGWVPNWNDSDEYKYVIVRYQNKIDKLSYFETNHFLSFQDEKTRDLFFENFRDLIEKANPLMS